MKRNFLVPYFACLVYNGGSSWSLWYKDFLSYSISTNCTKSRLSNEITLSKKSDFWILYLCSEGFKYLIGSSVMNNVNGLGSVSLFFFTRNSAVQMHWIMMLCISALMRLALVRNACLHLCFSAHSHYAECNSLCTRPFSIRLSANKMSMQSQFSVTWLTRTAIFLSCLTLHICVINKQSSWFFVFIRIY